MTVDDFFYENKLFPFLDYGITGRTLHGVVYIEIDLYSKIAKRLAAKLPSLRITLDEQTLDIAVLQLGSELQRAFGMVGQGNAAKKMLAEELHTLDAQIWKNIDEVAVIEPRNTELVPGAFYDLDNKKEILTKKVEVSYSFRPTVGADVNTSPLFIYIAKLISANAQVALSSQFGFYIDEIKYTCEPDIVKLAHSFRVVRSLEFSIEDVKNVIHDALKDIYDEKAFNKLTSRLSEVEDSFERLYPHPYITYERTNIIIGAKGWQQIATEENCKMILKHMKVTIDIDDVRSSLDVATTPHNDQTR